MDLASQSCRFARPCPVQQLGVGSADGLLLCEYCPRKQDALEKYLRPVGNSHRLASKAKVPSPVPG